MLVEVRVRLVTFDLILRPRDNQPLEDIALLLEKTKERWASKYLSRSHDWMNLWRTLWTLSMSERTNEWTKNLLEDWMNDWKMIEWTIDEMTCWMIEGMKKWRVEWIIEEMTCWMTEWLTKWQVEWIKNDWMNAYQNDILNVEMIEGMTFWMNEKWLNEWLTKWHVEWWNAWRKYVLNDGMTDEMTFWMT